MAHTLNLACEKCGRWVSGEYSKSPLSSFAFFVIGRWNFQVECDHCHFRKTYRFVGQKRLESLLEAGLHALKESHPQLYQLETQGQSSQPLPFEAAEVLEANAKDDWVLCPACSRQFKLTDPNRWDGTRHRSCGQRLLVGPSTSSH